MKNRTPSDLDILKDVVDRYYRIVSRLTDGSHVNFHDLGMLKHFCFG
jgi:hypothetical protein